MNAPDRYYKPPAPTEFIDWGPSEAYLRMINRPADRIAEYLNEHSNLKKKNMGFFSFKTSEGRSIPNIHSTRPTFTVFMVLPDGTKYREDGYDGYGEFDGKDFYEAVAELNGCAGRDAGCNLAFADPPIPGLLQPRFTDDPDKRWEDLTDPERCDKQGYFYDDE